MIVKISKDEEILAVGFDSQFNVLPIKRIKHPNKSSKIIQLNISKDGWLVRKESDAFSVYQCTGHELTLVDNKLSQEILTLVSERYNAGSFDDLLKVYESGDDILFEGLPENTLRKIYQTIEFFLPVGYVTAFRLAKKSYYVPFERVPLKWHLADKLENLSKTPLEAVIFIGWTKPNKAMIYHNLEDIPKDCYKVAKIFENKDSAEWALFADEKAREIWQNKVIKRIERLREKLA
nr:hypothetical protein [uncultured Moraxella sp.]